MPSISLNTATAITGLTKRTLWRHIHRGSLAVISEPGEETQVDLNDVLPLACLPLAPAEQMLIVAADAGDALAQTDLALCFLAADRPSDAVPWLIRAANQHYPDAMCYLGRCHLSGVGVERDADRGALWLSHAAVKGHPLAQALTQWLQSLDAQTLQTAHDQVAVDAALDQIEGVALWQVLQRTARLPNSINSDDVRPTPSC